MRDLFVMANEKPVKHVEGDTWTEQNKLWTIKNGIKRTVNKLDQSRKDHITPLSCPTCNRAMKKHYLEDKMWSIHKKCYSCVVDEEHEIQKAGGWKAYEKKKISANADSYLKDLEMYLEDEVNMDTTKNQITEDGMIEKWKNVSKDHLVEIKKTVLADITKKITDFKNNPE